MHSRTREWCNNRSHIRLYITRVPREMDIHIKPPFQYAVCKPPDYRSEILTVQLVHARSRFAAFQWTQFDSRRMACQDLFNVVIENREFHEVWNVEKLWSFLFNLKKIVSIIFLIFSGMKIKLFALILFQIYENLHWLMNYIKYSESKQCNFKFLCNLNFNLFFFYN